MSFFKDMCPFCKSEDFIMIGDPEYNDFWECEKCNRTFGSFLSVEIYCELCEDTGEISEDETDESGNVARGTLSRKCSCRIPEEDPDAWRDNNEDR